MLHSKQWLKFIATLFFSRFHERFVLAWFDHCGSVLLDQKALGAAPGDRPIVPPVSRPQGMVIQYKSLPVRLHYRRQTTTQKNKHCLCKQYT
jgi:hypothetical protein